MSFNSYMLYPYRQSFMERTAQSPQYTVQENPYGYGQQNTPAYSNYDSNNPYLQKAKIRTKYSSDAPEQGTNSFWNSSQQPYEPKGNDLYAPYQEPKLDVNYNQDIEPKTEPEQQEMSPFTAFSLGAKGVGSLANAWTAFHSMQNAKEQNKIAKQTASTNVEGQSQTIAAEAWSREYKRRRALGDAPNVANKTATEHVNNLELPSNISGGRFIYRRQYE